MKGSGVSGFVCLVELQIVHLQRNRVTGYWLTCGTVMEGCVLFQAMAHLYKPQTGNKNATLGYK